MYGRYLPLIEQAKANARHLYEQYRKLIPENSLDGYKSYCWKETFSVQWDRRGYKGQIGNLTFNKNAEHFGSRFLHPEKVFSNFQNNRFESNIICLPKVFLAGFYKCGSTFVYFVIRKLIFRSLGIHPFQTAVGKEPNFWVPTGQRNNFNLPDAKYLAKYILFFLPGLKQVTHNDYHDLVLVNGAPNKLFMWP